MSGYLFWSSGKLFYEGTYGFFWTSTPRTYTNSRYLVFTSTNVYSQGNDHNPIGWSLRCVARFFRTSTYAQKIIAPFLPELSAAFLFRL